MFDCKYVVTSLLAFQKILMVSATEEAENSNSASSGEDSFPSFPMHPMTMMGRRLAQTWDFIEHIMPNSQQLIDDNIFRKVFIRNHGCYCFSSETQLARPRNGYNGQPLDELDALCHELFRAQKCLKKEENCDLDRGYPFLLEKDDNDESTVICGASKGKSQKQIDNWKKNQNNQCKLQNCQLEKEFAIKVKALIDGGYRQTDESIVNIKDKNYDAICPPPVNPKPREFECCGNGINRKPFDFISKQCCEDKVVTTGSC